MKMSMNKKRRKKILKGTCFMDRVSNGKFKCTRFHKKFKKEKNPFRICHENQETFS